MPMSTWVIDKGRTVRAWVCLALPALVVGCGGGESRVPTYPVSGKVTIGNEIPSGALVVLYPAQAGKDAELRPSARVQPDGTFRLTTYDGDDGAPAGEYTATIQWHKVIKRGADYAAGPDVVPPEYTNPEKSPWKVTVRDTSNELSPLVIKR